jgi:hypothetical protein
MAKQARIAVLAEEGWIGVSFHCSSIVSRLLKGAVSAGY